MRAHVWLIGLLVASPLAAAPEPEHKHEEHEQEEHAHEHHEGEEASSARFDAGRGVRFTTEALMVLNIQTAPVELRTLSGVAPRPLRARVFTTRPHTRALVDAASLPADLSGLVIADARLREVDTLTGDAVFELTRSDLRIGQVVELTVSVSSRPTLAVPRAAVLRTAAGDFVYRAREGAFLRVPVTLGAADATHQAITTGLDAGATIVTQPVETLWLTELRLTKGGGHSH